MKISSEREGGRENFFRNFSCFLILASYEPAGLLERLQGPLPLLYLSPRSLVSYSTVLPSFLLPSVLPGAPLIPRAPISLPDQARPRAVKEKELLCSDGKGGRELRID